MRNLKSILHSIRPKHIFKNYGRDKFLLKESICFLKINFK
jgi:hypothetical protein